MRIHAEIPSENFNAQSIGLSLISSIKTAYLLTMDFRQQKLPTASLVGKDDNDYVITDTLRRTLVFLTYLCQNNGDNVTNFGRYAINGDGSRQYGNVYDIYSTSTLYSVKVRLDEEPPQMRKEQYDLIRLTHKRRN